jgi:hypothetical protein
VSDFAPIVPDHIRAAIHAGHVGQVTIYCDSCGVEDTGDYTGATKEIRFAVARQHLADVKGWVITSELDLCPACGEARRRQALTALIELPPDQFDALVSSLDVPDPAPKLTEVAARPRRYVREGNDDD